MKSKSIKFPVIIKLPWNNGKVVAPEVSPIFMAPKIQKEKSCNMHNQKKTQVPFAWKKIHFCACWGYLLIPVSSLILALWF